MQMKKLLLGLIVLVFAGMVNAAVITNFNSNIVVDKDASVVVTENINVQTDGAVIKHGLFRDLKTIYRAPDGVVRHYAIDVISAAIDGRSSGFHTENFQDGIRIYVGNKNQILPAGTYKFTIRYHLYNVIRFFGNHDELYWNVTGMQWPFPVEHASATVTLPIGLPDPIIKYTAYMGKFGARGQAYTANELSPNEIQFVGQQVLNPGEGLSLAVAIKKGLITQPSIGRKLFTVLSAKQMLFYGIAVVLIVLLYYLVVWYVHGRDPVMGAIVPEFYPPKDISPAAMRFVNDMGYDNKIFTAAVMQLAVKGYIKINELNKGKYQLDKSPGTAALTVSEKILLESLFKQQQSVNLSDSNNASQIRRTAKVYRKSLRHEFALAFFKKNTVWFGIGVVLSYILMIPIMNSYLIYFSGSEAAAPEFLMISLLFTFVFAHALVRYNFLAALKNIFKLNIKNIFQYLRYAIFPIVFVFVFVAQAGTSLSLNTFLPALILVIVNIVFCYLLRRPTTSGIELMRHARGFKMFLAATEKDQMNFRNPPEKTPQLFEKYLPYALALDVEQKWSEKFNDILKDSQYSPSWYSGSLTSFYLFSTAAGFAGSFSSAMTNSSVSGFSGGAGAGGGSGGGGGGGW